MKKLITTIIFLLIPCSIFSETIYDVIKLNNDIVTGYILEDNPGDFIMINGLDESLYIIKYVDILTIKVHNPREDKVVPEDTPGEEVVIIEESPEEIITVEMDPLVPVYTGYNEDELLNSMENLSIYQLSLFDGDNEKLEATDISFKINTYKELQKNDTLKMTLYNIVPGMGSIIQGDYITAIYTIASVAGALVYNLNDGFGTDYHLAVNLNMAFAYGVSFFAPSRYNDRYNSLLEEKLDI